MKQHARFSVADEKFETRVRESFSRQGLMKHLGAELVEVEPGQATIRVAFRDELTQQHNYFHAGVSGAIADSACGYAAYTLMPTGSSVLTVEYTQTYTLRRTAEAFIAPQCSRRSCVWQESPITLDKVKRRRTAAGSFQDDGRLARLTGLVDQTAWGLLYVGVK